MPKALLYLPQLVLGEEGREQPLRLLTTQDMELRCILDIHNLIAYIVCSLHEVDQRMAGIAQCRGGASLEAQLCGDLLHRLLLGSEEAELTLPSCQETAIGILHDARHRAIRQGKAPRTATTELMCQEAEGIRIPLEVEEVLPASTLGTYQGLPALPWAFAEVSADRTLPAVSEGRIPHIVCQTRSADDGTDPRAEGRLTIGGIALGEHLPDDIAQRAPEAAHLEAMRQAVVHEDVPRQWEDLRLIL